MHKTAVALIFLGSALGSAPLSAQQRIPPGHMPGPGECRVWYDGRPPGHQPAPVSCQEAERIAAREPRARVVYGDRIERTDDRRWENGGRGRGRGRGRGAEADERGRGRGAGREREAQRRDQDSRDRDDRDRDGNEDRAPAFNNGYADGLAQGRTDARNNREYDPTRHNRYQTADRGYNARYGTRDEYRNAYRDGFRAGYEDGYEGTNANQGRGGFRFPWPF